MTDERRAERRTDPQPVSVDRRRGERRALEKCCCPHCGSWASRVREGRPDGRGYRRTRCCSACGKAYVTFEKVA